MKRIFVSRTVYPEALAVLRRAGDVDYRDDRDAMSPDAFAERARDVHALVCQLTDPVTADLIDGMRELEVIANVAVGFDNIDVAAATARGIPVTNTPGVLTEATADLTLALMLAHGRRLVEADRFVRDGRWRQWEIDLLCGRDLHGSTLGIVGMGRIGRAVARRARGFGMQVVFWNRSVVEDPEVLALGRQVHLEELLATSATVSMHVALTPETRGLLGAGELELMRSDAVVVNTARGGVVDQAALVAALAERRIAGAALDVFEDEPAVPPELLALPNVLVAPHLGSATVGTRTRMCVMAAENAAAVLRGEPPQHPVNPEVLAT